MCRIARRVLSRFWLLFLLGAAGLMAFKDFDGGHSADGYLTGNAMVLCQLGLAGLLCTAIEKLGRDPASARERREAAELLLRALEAMPEQPEEGRPRYPHAVP